MIRTTYFPALSGGPVLKSLHDKKITWSYPYFLSSAAYNLGPRQNFKEYCNLNDKIVLVGDSGGFQIATKKVKYTDELRSKIFEWLETNTQYAMNLDIPPYAASSDVGSMRETGTFKESLGISYKNMKYFSDNMSGKTKYLNVLHGRSAAAFEEWYKKVGEFNFTGGWGLGSVAYSLYLNLYALLFLKERGEFEKNNFEDRFFHTLGLSHPESILALVYLQKRLHELGYKFNISYDSATPFMLAAFGTYVVFSTHNVFCKNAVNISYKVDWKSLENSDVPMPCNCVACKGKTWKDIAKYHSIKENGKVTFETDFYVHMSLHNFYKFLDFKNKMENIIFSHKDLYESFLDKNFLAIFDVIDGCLASNHPLEYLQSHRSVFKDYTVMQEVVKMDALFD